MGLKYMRPDENVLLGGTVSGGAASGYDDDDLVDGQIHNPAKATTGSQAWAATGATGSISLVVVANHNIDAARAIAISGDVSASMAGPAARANGINVNPWAEISPEVSGNDVTVTVASNSAALTIGELLAGKLREFTNSLRIDAQFDRSSGSIEHKTDGGSILIFERPWVARTLKGTIVLESATERRDLEAWWESTRSNTKPSVIVPLENEQDAWCVLFRELSIRLITSEEEDGPSEATVTFEEFPRYRW